MINLLQGMVASLEAIWVAIVAGINLFWGIPVAIVLILIIWFSSGKLKRKRKS